MALACVAPRSTACSSPRVSWGKGALPPGERAPTMTRAGVPVSVQTTMCPAGRRTAHPVHVMHEHTHTSSCSLGFKSASRAARQGCGVDYSYVDNPNPCFSRPHQQEEEEGEDMRRGALPLALS